MTDVGSMSMEELQAENARLREQLRVLEEKSDALDAKNTVIIQKLIEENEILADANRLLMENQETYAKFQKKQEEQQQAALSQVPDELLIPGNGISTNEICLLEDVHSFGNLLCVAAHATKPEVVVTGGVDKHVVIHDWQQKRKLCQLECSAPVLDLAFNPNATYADYFVASMMDGKCGLYRMVDHDGTWSIQEIQVFADHTRHGGMKIVWNGNGTLFATGSSDKSVHMYKCLHLNPSADAHTVCEKIKSFYFNGTVEAMVFIPPVTPSDEAQELNGTTVRSKELLAITVRDDCYMHYVDCDTMEKERLNMNTDGIEHVSYTILDLQLSPSGKYLLAATDTNRHFIIEVKSNVVLRNFYGHKAGPYSQPRATWHPSEKYVVSNTEDGGAVYVWCIASERVVNTIQAHDAMVRGLVFAHGSTVPQLLTVSYDKRLKAWTSTTSN